MYSPNFNSDKFRKLMLNIADRSRDDPCFGDDKLSVTLYYCDFRAFAKLQRSITGASYTKSPQCPVPTEMMAERQALINEGIAKVEVERSSNNAWHRLIPVPTACELGNEFDGREIEIIDEVMQTIAPLSNTEAADLARDEFGWIMANEQERIPYESVWLVSKRDTDTWMLTQQRGIDTPEN